MGSDIGEKVTAGISAFIGLAVVAIVISQRANTVNVIGTFMAGITNLIGVAISPITGQSVSGLSAAGLTGGSWTTGLSGFASNASGFTTGTGGVSLNLGNLGGSLNSLFGGGSTGTTGSGGSTGVIDNGTFGTGPQTIGDGGGAPIDTGTF
jgi:hypothetical protein